MCCFQVKSWFSRQLRKQATSDGGATASGSGQTADDELEEEEEEALLENFEHSMYEENLRSASD